MWATGRDFRCVMRSEELLDVLRVAFRHVPDSEHREQPVGQHLLLGAVCEHEVADQHAADEVADDRPGDDLHDEAGATLRANGLSEYEAKKLLPGGRRRCSRAR